MVRLLLFLGQLAPTRNYPELLMGTGTGDPLLHGWYDFIKQNWSRVQIDDGFIFVPKSEQPLFGVVMHC